jgi:hypothetical protein
VEGEGASFIHFCVFGRLLGKWKTIIIYDFDVFAPGGEGESWPQTLFEFSCHVFVVHQLVSCKCGSFFAKLNYSNFSFSTQMSMCASMYACVASLVYMRESRKLVFSGSGQISQKRMNEMANFYFLPSEESRISFFWK